ncbi:MAG TPA: SigE family RNA polymerase sigma factor [Kineosporiaceae bacterium]|nr:SigE family RNA polymerase sigma factor [Kineosporiaceae bacterium]
MDGAARERFGQFVADRGPTLFRTAYLLTGDANDAEDLVQSALERLARRFDAVERADNTDAYVRRVIVNLATDAWRARRRRSHLRYLEVDEGAAPDVSGLVGDRDMVVGLLRSLPPRQRTALVLRYWLGLTDREIADSMGCAVGTVKSQLSRGIGQLRTQWATEPQVSGLGRGDQHGH